jgi:hypothetical protein
MQILGRRLSFTSVVAAACLLGGAAIAWSTFQADSDRLSKLDSVLGDVAAFDDPSKASALDGKIVIAHGTATPRADLSDPDFNLNLPALKLFRDSQIYQWKENGGKFRTYEQVWSEELIDSTYFDMAHSNQGALAYPDRFVKADKIDIVRDGVRLAALDASYSQFIGGEVKLMLEWEQYKKLPVPMQLRFDLVNGSLVEKSAAAGNPRIGDNRTRFTMVPPYEVTVVGVLVKGKILSYDRTMKEVGILKPGNLTVAQLRESIQDDILDGSGIAAFFAGILGVIGCVLFRNDFRSAPRVSKPIKPLQFGR